jgi:hypothetical protein
MGMGQADVLDDVARGDARGLIVELPCSPEVTGYLKRHACSILKTSRERNRLAPPSHKMAGHPVVGGNFSEHRFFRRA